MPTRILTPICALFCCAIASGQEQTINFETLPEGTIITTVFGDAGAGPIDVLGTNPDLPGLNVAVVFDTANPVGDADLGSPNQTCPDPPGSGPGVGNGGKAGATNSNGQSTENCPLEPLGHIIIVAEDLNDADMNGLVDIPDDAAVAGTLLSFDFSAALGSVSISSITLLDVEQSENAATVSLWADSARTLLINSFVLAKTGNNGLLVFDLGTNPDVVVMDVAINGSGAIDNIVFTPGPCPPDIDCGDGNPCTLDECDPLAGGCVNIRDDSACDDGNVCNGIETCDPSDGCVAGTPLDCDDDDACTTDDCDPVDGCVNDPIGDGNCDDGVDCTIDSCVPGEGCVSIPDDAACNDGDNCTVDKCDPVDGCQYNGGPEMCDDGIDCTKDTCEFDGSCENKPVNFLCDDGVDCTVDSCNPDTGCESKQFDDLCDDGDECTMDLCKEEGCVFEPIDGCGECKITCEAEAVCDDSSPADGGRVASVTWKTEGFCSEVEASVDFKCTKAPVENGQMVDYLCGCTPQIVDGKLTLRGGSATLVVSGKNPQGETVGCEIDLCDIEECP